MLIFPHFKIMRLCAISQDEAQGILFSIDILIRCMFIYTACQPVSCSERGI